MNEVPLVWRPLMLRIRWSSAENWLSSRLNYRNYIVAPWSICVSLNTLCVWILSHLEQFLCLWSEQNPFALEFSIWSSKRIRIIESTVVFFCSSLLVCIVSDALILETSLDLHQHVFGTVKVEAIHCIGWLVVDCKEIE